MRAYIIVAIIILFIALFLNSICIFKFRKKETKITFVFTALVFVLLILMMVPYAKQSPVYVEFEEIACVELETGVLEGYDDWYTVYNIDCVLFRITDDCVYKYPNLSSYKGEFSEMDTSKYTYVYTFGAPLVELYYNVWDCEGIPILDFGLSTKWGKAVLDNKEKNNKVYMYRISKMAIANKENTIRY